MNLKYSAIYSDTLGCDKCYVYFEKDNIILKVRGFEFYSNNYDFDFYCDENYEVKKNFYLKDNELIEYVLDVRILLPLIENNREYTEKAILRIERQKNLYKNTILIDKNDKRYYATGINFSNIINNLKRRLPLGYEIKQNIYEYLSPTNDKILTKNV